MRVEEAPPSKGRIRGARRVDARRGGAAIERTLPRRASRRRAVEGRQQARGSSSTRGTPGVFSKSPISAAIGTLYTQVNRDLLGDNARRNLADFTFVEEEPGKDDLVVDGCKGCNYLVGLCKRQATGALYKLFMARVDGNTGLLDSYMVLKNKLDWTGRPCTSDCTASSSGAPCACGNCFSSTTGGDYCVPTVGETKNGLQVSGFGAARVPVRNELATGFRVARPRRDKSLRYTYFETSTGQLVLFTSNQAWGLMALQLPIVLNSTICPWNTNPNATDYAIPSKDVGYQCDVLTTVAYRGESVATQNNDGMSCRPRRETQL